MLKYLWVKKMKINANQVELNYEVYGQGEPLILLHGNQEDMHIFDELIQSIKDEFTIYTIDSRNHGKSSKSIHFSYDDMTQDVYQFIRALKINKPHILGFSDGGIIGLKLAIFAPNLMNKLIVCGSNYKPKGLTKQVRKELKIEYKQYQSPFIKLMLKEPKIKKKDLKNILNPVLIVVGSNDCIKEKHTLKMHHFLKHSNLKVIEDHTHDSYIVHQDLLKPDIINFLKK